jgi:biotin carboxyl carrier protein
LIGVATYEVTLGERVLRIAVRHASGGTFVRVDDGPERRADLRRVHGALHSLLLGQQRREVALVARGGDIVLAVEGLEYYAEVVDEAHARVASVAGARAVSHTRRELRAPMPGLLVKVLCAPGDAVHANQPLAVLQAMKMENELGVSRGGTVTQVNVEAGQTVEQGQVLIVVE